MIKKLFLSLTLYLFLTNCGFTPLYSVKGLEDINIEVLSYEGDRQINLDLVSKLKTNVNPQGKIYKVKIYTDYEKTTLSNNLAGEPEEYQLQSTIKFIIVDNETEKEFSLNEKFVMKNLNDDFEERNYETNIKSNMVNLIYNKFLLQIKKLR